MAARAMHIRQCFPHVSQTAHIYYVQTQSRLPRPMTRVRTRSDNMQNVMSARILKTTIKSPRSLCTVYHLRGLLNFTGQNGSSSSKPPLWRPQASSPEEETKVYRGIRAHYPLAGAAFHQSGNWPVKAGLRLYQGIAYSPPDCFPPYSLRP
jgi:hypothetical protein